jgi:CHAT domain-containing protein
MLAMVPWGLLPPLHGRPVTVAPSASAWLAAGTDRRPGTGRALVVAGPGLEHSEHEVDRLAAIHPDGTVLRGPEATVGATLAALDGCTTAHFAAHGHHEQENILFSRLDLADGPLMAYDIQQLESVPAHVVLAACDIGQTVVRAGDEILGFTAALLYNGSRTVVSSVARVDDRASVEVMAAYHRACVRGVPPARALAEAGSADPATPLVCFGRGS